MRLVCERAGQQVAFGYDWPLWLESVDGLEESLQSVSTRKPTGADGEQYTGSTADKRNILITAAFRGTPEEHQALRDQLYAFFQPREAGTLYLYDHGTAKRITYYPERCSFGTAGRLRRMTVSLICPDPIFYGTEDETVDMAEVVGLLEWPVELTGSFEVGRRTGTLMASITNLSSVARGLTIRFEAAGEVVNPGMVEVTRQESFTIRATMHTGDIITVTTGEGEKRVYLTRGVTTTNINHLWTFGGTWLQARPGENVFRYTAKEGSSALSASITSTPAFWGA